MKTESLPPLGTVTLVVAFAMLVLLMFAALAVDRGYYYVALNELQNSADAGALAGAGRLASPLTSDGFLAWEQARGAAEDVGLRNTSGSGVVPKVQALIGYWNLDSKAFISSSNPSPVPPTERDYPGVRVISSRTTATNNAVPQFLASLVGIDSVDASKSAIAVISAPGFVDQRDLFAFVMSQCLYDRYWDYSRSPPGPRLDPAGNPYVFQIPSDAQSLCLKNDTAWTPLGLGNNTASVRSIVRSYKTANPIDSKRYAIGDSISVSKEGTFTAVINEIETCILPPPGDGRCVKINVAVVDNIPDNASGEGRIITAFSCLQIVEARHPRYVKVRMDTTCPPPPSAGGFGPNFGTFTPPALVADR